MIKHSKVRSLIASAMLGTFIFSIGYVTLYSPTHSVENKSVNEQICSQPEALEMETELVIIKESAPQQVVVSENKITLTSNRPVIVTQVEKTEGKTRKKKQKKTVGYTIGSVNVREEPSLQSKILDTYEYRTKVKYVDSDSDWVMIKHGGKKAYMCKRYLSGTIPPEQTQKIQIASVSHKTTYESSGQKLTRNLGTVNGPSGKETYYNLSMNRVVEFMKDLGYDYEYWVRDDGCKMYGDYIMIAANTKERPKGTIIETSLGTGMVCDHCVAAEWTKGQIDIAVNWK